MKMRFLAFFILVSGGFSGYTQEEAALSEEKIISDNEVFRKKMNDFFSDPEKSSLPLFLIDEFEEAPYFDLNTDYVVQAKLEYAENGPIIKMKTSTDRIAEYRVLGKAYFELNGDSLSLDVYKNKDGEEDHMFLPFKDLTNGERSYIAGRYLEIESPTNGSLIIDFNKSYNPSCAYSNRYSCPLVPINNHLNTEIPVGAKYEKHEEGWNELDQQPSYLAGREALLNHLRKNVTYPKKARKKKIEGVVYIKMIVDKDGSLSNFAVAKGFHQECDEVALNAVRSLGDFKPAMKGDKVVRAPVIIPINFKL